MFSLRVTAVLLAIFCATCAFQCYNGVMTSNQHPSNANDCNGQFCTKIVSKSANAQVYSYGCDQTNLCSSQGCSNVANTQLCCCSGNLCNSSTKLSAIFAVVPLAVIKLLAF
ncbi:hypothetical protein Q1695_006604 [Nippostrongylus brasiliensis]|nr:hypothetical protein Q1695_006604 [Nippostrongylus brasiliensis]